MVRANPNLMKEIRKYSNKDFNIEACFNCGNCTAICPLADEKHQFPRSLIRYAQLGLKDKILSSNLLWLCGYCSDCSDTCPREAEPGELVMTTRRWAMAQYDVTGIGRILATKWWGGPLAMFLIFLISLVLFGIFGHPENVQPGRPIRLFDLVPSVIVEIVGIGMAAVVIAVIGLSILNQYRLLGKVDNPNPFEGIIDALNTRNDKTKNTVFHLVFSPLILIKQAIMVVVFEIFGQKRQIACELEKEKKDRSILLSRWMMHILILWGFFGLGLATILNLLFKHDANELVTLDSPFLFVRILGLTSGVIMLAGVTIAIYNRIKKNSNYSKHSVSCDYILLINLFMVGITGLLTTTTFYILEIDPLIAYWLFVIHMIFVIELILLAPFGKFAHVWYRSFALWIHFSLENRERNLEKELQRIEQQKQQEKVTAQTS